jgi:hypothetical protein
MHLTLHISVNDFLTITAAENNGWTRLVGGSLALVF